MDGSLGSVHICMPKAHHKAESEDGAVATAVQETDEAAERHAEVVAAEVQVVAPKPTPSLKPPKPRISETVIFTDNYPQALGKQRAAIIMDVRPNGTVYLGVFDPTQNPISHPRDNIVYDASGKPGTWKYPED